MKDFLKNRKGKGAGKELAVYAMLTNMCVQKPSTNTTALGKLPLCKPVPSLHNSLRGTQSWITHSGWRGRRPTLPLRPRAPQAAVLINTWARCIPGFDKKEGIVGITFPSCLGTALNLLT